MTHTFPQAETLAEELIAYFRDDVDASAAAAAERAVAAIGGQVGLMVGAHGFALLVGRALVRAARRHPLLADVSVDAADGRFLRGLDTVVRQSAADEADPAHAVVAELIGLLARFLGPALATRLVGQAVPGTSAGGTQNTHGMDSGLTDNE